MKINRYLILSLFLVLVFQSNLQAQNEYLDKNFQFTAYDAIPSWKAIVFDWNKSPKIHLFDAGKYEGHANYVCYGMNTGIRFAQFKELVRHPEKRVYLPIFVYDLRSSPIEMRGKKHSWAVRLEHYSYTDDNRSMAETMRLLMESVESYLRTQDKNVGKGIVVLAPASAALPNMTIAGTVEQAGYPAMTTTRLIAAFVENQKRSTKDKEVFETNGEICSMKVLNGGLSMGRIRIVEAGEEDKVKSDFENILVYENLPYRVPIANGIITLQPQTPLSHINLLAKNRGTINAYGLGDSQKQLELWKRYYDGKFVRIECKREGNKHRFDIKIITENEAKKHWASQKKLKIAIPKPDLSVTSFSHFGLGARSVQTVNCIGAKAANYALLQHELPEYLREGFAIPFYFYFQTIKNCGADKLIASLLKNKSNLSESEIDKGLETIRNRILGAELDPAIFKELERIGATYYKGKRIRLRSSTNCEDLPQFNGAGLYVSKGYQQGSEQGIIEKKILKVYASLWLPRAFEERDFFGIDHLQAGMAVLINGAFPEEYANGVALTIPNETGTPSIHINTQYGELSVTNPEGAEVPEIIYFAQFDSKWYVTESESSVHHIFVKDARMTPLARQLQSAMAKIDQLLRKKLTDPQNYGVDVEFKIMREEGQFKLYIKQARLLNMLLPE